MESSQPPGKKVINYIMFVSMWSDRQGTDIII